VVLDQMSSRGIAIYSVGCQPALSQYQFATDFFIAAAQRTNGQAVALGSAGALADVIMGASVEEMDLEALTNEVQRMTAAFRSAEPALADTEVEQRVWASLQARGTKTRQMGGDRLASAHANLVSAAPSLASAKAALSEAAPPAPKLSCQSVAARASASELRSCARGAPLRGVPRGGEADDDLLGLLGSEIASDLSACSVALSEETISMAQVQRLYGRGKKKGLW